MRADLANMTAEALEALSNVGLVKRAKREVAEGKGPCVREEPDGTVIATFAEGVTTTLGVGQALEGTQCSCGAKKVCRHRVAAVLAYAVSAGVATRPPWSVGVDELDVWLGPRVAAVDAAESSGVDLELTMRPWAARFADCTVRFRAGADLGHATCDCGRSSCVHVPLAVRAFQRLSVEERQRALVQVRLGPPARQAVFVAELSAVEVYLGRLLHRGIANARGLEQPLAEARAHVRDCPWLDGVLEDLDEQRVAWDNRSALHDASRVRSLFMEGFARVRAAQRGRDPVTLLGVGEPLQTAMGKVRLLSLGARLSAVGSSRSIEMLFWDGATVLSWVVPIPANADPATVMVVGKTPLGVLAGGMLVSSDLVRFARRTIDLRRGKDTSVYPQRGEWSTIAPPHGFSGPSVLLQSEKDRLPSFLRPRSRTEALRVVATPHGVKCLSWSPGRQTLSAVIDDGEGVLVVERHYEWFAPGAIAALVQALPSACFVSGWLRGSGGMKVLEPIAVIVGRDNPVVIVPDLAPDAPIPPLPTTASEVTNPLDTVLGRVESTLDVLAQEGVCGGRIASLGAVLSEIGMRNLADVFGRLEAARAAGDAAVATNAWADAAIAVALARA